jgi:4-amino-4-deoxy-L-arabinose transferase-like glycosyltransferase
LDQIPAKPRLILLFGIIPIFIGLFAYAVTWAFVWDEGFHLIAAQLIANGKRPYLDFCFPQTPLNAYINSSLILAFGNQWKAIHILAAAYICVAVWLVADFVQSRLPVEKWRTPCALAAAGLFGLDVIVVQFGPIGQAYAIGMFLGTAAYRAALPAVSSRRPWFALLAGLCAGGAAASTLLTAPVPLVLLLWLVFWNVEGSKLLKAAAYLIGCAVPFTPVFWLYLQGPKQTLFNVLQYQALFRGTNWGDANLHDMDALTDWLTSPQALLLMALFAAALLFLKRQDHSTWPKARREFLLAATLSVALALFISTAHPTFERYYVVAVPYIAIVASLGLYAAASRLAGPQQAWLSCGIIIALTYCMFFREVFDDKDSDHFSGYYDVAKAVTEVTPLGANLYADEVVYFILQREPPTGMEFSYSQKLELPPDQERLFRLVSNKELKEQLKAGKFATFETCRQGIMDDLEPAQYFKQHSEPNDCDLFWEPKAKASADKR